MSFRSIDGNHPPDVTAVVKRVIILKHRLQKGVATPPPEYLAQWMAKWSEQDRDLFVKKIGSLYARQIQTLRESGLWDEMDQDERYFLEAGPTEIPAQALVDANWLGESIICLLWALGYIPEIPPYDQAVSREVRKHLAKVPTRILEETATLRPAALIEKQRDLAELWHWRSRTRPLQEGGRMPAMLDSRGLTIERVLQLSSAKAAEEGMAPPPIDGDFPAFGKPYRSLTPDEFSIATSIAMERHRAFNWMCGYAPGNRWADTPTET